MEFMNFGIQTEVDKGFIDVGSNISYLLQSVSREGARGMKGVSFCATAAERFFFFPSVNVSAVFSVFVN